MRFQRYESEDEFAEMLQRSCESDFAAFCADLKADPGQSAVASSLKKSREAEDLEQTFRGWEEELQISALKGDRLRTPDRIDPDFLGELNSDFGVPERPLHKRHEPMKGRPNSIVKGDGGWTYAYDSQGNLFRAFGPTATEKNFDVPKRDKF